jgi:hypothetical protein
LLSTSNIASFFSKRSARFVQFFASSDQKSKIPFGSSVGYSSFNQISSAAQIIQLLSTHLILVFFIVTVSVPCHDTTAHNLATATA